MLSADVVNCIRESIEAELTPRDRSVRAAILALMRRLAAKGLAHSGNAVHERVELGRNELTLRAELVWSKIQRCHRAFAASGEDAQLVDNLHQQIAQHLGAQTSIVVPLVDIDSSPLWPPRVRGTISAELLKHRNELINRFCAEARLYAEEARRRPEAVGTSVNIHGPVGAVQTGAYATAYVYIDAAGGARLAEALNGLQAAISAADDIGAEQREQSSEVVVELIIESMAPKPNGLRVGGLLLGLATTIQTVASLRAAWDAVRIAASGIGIHLP